MATYNGEKYIRQQMDSILCQLGQDDEIIVSDDGSTDKTLDILKEINDPRIKIYSHHKDPKLMKMRSASFRLAAKNFEHAMKIAHGDFIYLADQDDIWLPNRVKMVQSLLWSYDLIMCNYSIINDDNEVLVEQYYEKSPVSRRFFLNLMRTPFLGCCMAFRRSVLSYCLPLPKACIGHDFWMGCLICKLGSFKYIEKPLHLYRKHSNNVSPVITKSKNTFLFKILYRIKFVYDILVYSKKYKSRAI